MIDTVLKQEAISVLKSLIAIPSFSGEEKETANLLEQYLKDKSIPVVRKGNNILAKNLGFSKGKPTLVLNSHHDTVKPNSTYSRDPFLPDEDNGKIYGLGANDAGGCLVALLVVFIHFYKKEDLPYNIWFVASAEEETSGPHGMRLIYKDLGPIDFAIVGEPTQMDMAIAEKGLMVLDGYTSGPSGHAAHGKENSIYKAMEDVQWFQEYQFPKKSELLNEVHMQVTQIEAGTQHNSMPVSCHYVVDVRVNNLYTNQMVFDCINKHTNAKIIPRSTRLNSSEININHSIVKIGELMGKRLYGSNTLSDQALMACPSLKMGPGDTKRSHAADEFIYRHEIEQGIDDYSELLTAFFAEVKEINKKNKTDEIVG